MKTSRLTFTRAFTLIEVLVAVTVFVFASAGIMTLYMYTLQNNFVSEQRLLANNDVRYFTENLINNARTSHYLVLYKCFYPYAAGAANNVFPYTGTLTGSPLTPYVDAGSSLDVGDEITNDGTTGDFLVLITYSDPSLYYVAGANGGTIPEPQVTRIVMYWVAPNINFSGETAMYMFDSHQHNDTLPWNGTNLATNPGSPPTWHGPTLSTASKLESLLPANTLAMAQSTWAHIVLNDIRGLSSDGTNFTNYPNTQNTSVLMHSLILHGNASKRVTDTYNFTITPGG